MTYFKFVGSKLGSIRLIRFASFRNIDADEKQFLVFNSIPFCFVWNWLLKSLILSSKRRPFQCLFHEKFTLRVGAFSRKRKTSSFSVKNPPTSTSSSMERKKSKRKVIKDGPTKTEDYYTSCRPTGRIRFARQSWWIEAESFARGQSVIFFILPLFNGAKNIDPFRLSLLRRRKKLWSLSLFLSFSLSFFSSSFPGSLFVFSLILSLSLLMFSLSFSLLLSFLLHCLSFSPSFILS